MNRDEDGQGFESFKKAYEETKTRLACYMATETDQWLKVAWKNETIREYVSLKR